MTNEWKRTDDASGFDKLVETDSTDAVTQTPAPEQPVTEATHAPAVEEAAIGQRPLAMGFGASRELFSAKWWRFAYTFVLAGRKYTLKPALLFGIGMVLPIIGTDIVSRTLTTHTTFNGIGEIVAVFGLLLVTMLVCALGAFVMLVLSIAISLVVLTGLCRSYLTFPFPQSGNPDPSLLAQSQQEAVQHFYGKKAFLVTVWIMYSIIIAVPFVAWLVSGAVIALQFMPPPYHVDWFPFFYIPNVIICSITTIFMTNYALVLMACSAISERGGTRVAIDALSLTWKTLPGLTLFSLIFIVLSSTLSNVVDIIVMVFPAWTTDAFARYGWILLKVLCNIIMMVIIVPFSFIIPCEMVRGNIKNQDDTQLSPRGK